MCECCENVNVVEMSCCENVRWHDMREEGETGETGDESMGQGDAGLRQLWILMVVSCSLHTGSHSVDQMMMLQHWSQHCETWCELS